MPTGGRQTTCPQCPHNVGAGLRSGDSLCSPRRTALLRAYYQRHSLQIRVCSSAT
jgi:hypothetical protein